MLKKCTNNAKKCLLLVLSYLEKISLQTRTKLLTKDVLNCYKLGIVFKCQTRLSNSFHYKEPIPKDLVSGVVYKFPCGIRHLDIRSGEYIGVSPLTGQVKPSNNSAICDHLLLCKFLPSSDNLKT